MIDILTMRLRLVRLCAALLALAILAMSVVPPDLRPVIAGQDTEHLLAFIAFGASVGLSYPGRSLAATLALFLFTGGVELVQLLVPGRHARWEDFVVDLLGSLAGLLLAAVVRSTASRFARRAPRATTAKASREAKVTP